MKKSCPTEVIVLGGGYAGVTAALRLSRQTRRANVRISLINGRDYFVERIRLHQQAAGQTGKRHSYTSLLAGTPVRFLQGWVTRLLPEVQQITVETPAGVRQLHYDYVICALGSVVETTSVPGVSDHALSLSTVETTELLRETLPTVAADGGHLLVCGGGLTGIEAASELAESYPTLQVTLVTADRFGEQLSARGRRYLQQAFERRGIVVRNRRRVAAVHADQIELEDGAILPFNVCLWAASFRAPALARASGLPVNSRDQILVDEFLRVKGWPNIYAIGDAASLEEALSIPIRMGCATAAPMGIYVGNQLARVIQGDQPDRPYGFRYVMRCISLGRNDGLIQFVERDDTPTERILTGRIGAAVKELVSSASVWNLQFEQKLASLFAGKATTASRHTPYVPAERQGQKSA